MKKVNLFLSLMSVLLLAFSSCSENEEIIVDAAEIGDITISKSSTIATGQVITFQVPLVQNSPAQTIDKVYWYKESEGIGFTGVGEDGYSTFSTSWSSPGTYEVSCKYTYIFDSESCSVSSSQTIEVVQSHFLNSLIGEALDVVLADNPSLYLLEGTTDTYCQVVDDVYYYLTFKDEKLSVGETYQTNVSTGTSAAVGYLNLEYNNSAKSKINTSTLTYSVVYNSDYTPTDEVQAAVEEFETTGYSTTENYNALITSAVQSGEIVTLELKAEIIDNADVQLSITVGKDPKTENGYYTILQVAAK
ncbi:MAG: hypothetical protein R3Y04_08925 [Rikenellaceae bacterium]